MPHASPLTPCKGGLSWFSRVRRSSDGCENLEQDLHVTAVLQGKGKIVLLTRTLTSRWHRARSSPLLS